MNSPLLRRVLAVSLGLATLFAPLTALPVHAATYNTVIKGSGSTLYWYASNGKRYVFPNVNTYYSWYPNFSNVNTISDTELTSIPLAGNVTYRPGAKLIKITTNPKVYAVARNGTLRWVTSEYIASQLYGADWKQKIHDVPDVFFINYQVGGMPIWNAWEYNVSNEYNGVYNPSDSLPIAMFPVDTGNLSGAVQLTASNTNVRTNESVTLTATVSSLSTSITNTVIRIYDEQSGSLQRTCTGTWSCSVTVFPNASYGTSKRYYVDVSDGYAGSLSRAYSPYIYVDYNGNSNFQGTVNVTADRTSVRQNETLGFTATVTSYNTAVQNLTIRLYDERNGTLLRTCNGASTCTYTMTASGSYGTSFRIYADASNQYTSLSRAYSPYVYLDSSSNSNNNGALSLAVDRTNVLAGDMVTFTANVNQYSYGGQYWTVRIYDERSGALMRTCSGTTSCSYSYPTGGQNNQTFRFYADATDGYTTLSRAYSSYVTVGQSGSGSTAGTLSGLTDIYIAPAARVNSTIYVTASITNSSIAAQNLTIRVYDSRYSDHIGLCSGAFSCSIPFTIGSANISTSVYATFTDQNGNTVRTGNVNVSTY
jgi:acyl-coenzyme A thioesterase PaaI-like protein